MNVEKDCNIKIIKEGEIKLYDKLWDCKFNPKYNVIAIVGVDKKLYLLSFICNDDSLNSNIVVDVIKEINTEHVRSLRCVSWDSSGELLIIGSFDATSSLYYIKNLIDIKNIEIKLLKIFKGQESEIKSVAFSPSSEFIATCSRDKSIWIWQAEIDDSSKIITKDKDCLEYDCMSILDTHTQDVKHVEFHKERNDILFSSSYDNSIKLWCFVEEEEDWINTQTVTLNNTIWKISSNETNFNKYICCCEDKSIYLFESNNNGTNNDSTINFSKNFKQTKKFSNVHSRSVYCVKYIENMIVSGGGDNKVKISEIIENELVPIYEYQHDNDVNSLDIKIINDCNNIAIISCGDDWKLKIKTMKLS